MKKQIVAVGNSEVAVKEFRGQRVVTFKDIDTVHERPEGTAKRNFSDNRKRFVEGEFETRRFRKVRFAYFRNS